MTALAALLADMPSMPMPTGLDAAREDPLAAGLAVGAILALAAGSGFALRRWSGRLRTLRAQLLVVTSAAIGTAAVAAWLLADLMILDEDQLQPVLVVLGLTAAIAVVVVSIASRSLGRAAHDLEASVRRIEAGDREPDVPVHRADELGHVARALEGLTRRLAELEEEQAALDAERNHMLSSISHDLRSPLAALRAALEAMIDGVARDPDRYLRAMQADVDALTALVDDFFLLARIEGGRLALDLGTVDLGECCDEGSRRSPPPRWRGASTSSSTSPSTSTSTGTPTPWAGWCATWSTTPSATRRRGPPCGSRSVRRVGRWWPWSTRARASPTGSPSTPSSGGAGPTRAAAA